MKNNLVTLLVSGLLASGVGTVDAATWVPFSATAGVQCSPIDINDSGMTIGACSPANVAGNVVPWVADAAVHGAQTPLAPLASGQSCGAIRISNAGQILGGCVNAVNAGFAVVWNAASPAGTPLQLAPLPAQYLIIIKTRDADVETSPAVMNHRGDVVGTSSSSSGAGTVVFYPVGSGTPQPVSSFGDNCSAVDVNLPASGNLKIAMNCPNGAGNFTAKVAEQTGSTFAVTALALPTGASYCRVNRVNASSQFLGTCFYPNSAANVNKSAFWGSSTSAPIMLTLSTGSKNSGIDLTDTGFALVRHKAADGIPQRLLWFPSTAPLPIVQFINLPAGIKWGTTGIIANGNRVALDVLTSDQHFAACTWMPTTSGDPAVCLPSIGSGNSGLAALSQNGAYMAGEVMTDNQTSIAVSTALP